MNKLFSCLAGMLLLLTFSCEKLYLPNEQSKGEDSNGNVTLCVSAFEQMPFTQSGKQQSLLQMRASRPIKGLCARLNFAVFQNGEKVKNISQKSDDSGFGTAKIALAPGDYELVIVAHNSAGTATISAPNDITFPSNRLTDTFYYYGMLTVTDQSSTHNLNLQRVVAMFRLVLRDETLPLEFAQMKFYYTGGSSTLDATQGVGAKQSRQTEVFSVADATQDLDGNSVFEVYTFPRPNSDALKMTVTAQNAAGAPILERIFLEVPVVRNQITQYAGVFFQESGGNAEDITLTADPEWGGQKNFVF